MNPEIDQGTFSEIFGRAARGDADAQSFMAQAALTNAEYAPEVAVAICDLWSRMAAIRGRWEDMERVIACSSRKAAHHLEGGHVGEAVEEIAKAIVILNHVDEQGTVSAGLCLTRLMDAAREDNLLEPALARAKELERDN